MSPLALPIDWPSLTCGKRFAHTTDPGPRFDLVCVLDAGHEDAHFTQWTEVVEQSPGRGRLRAPTPPASNRVVSGRNPSGTRPSGGLLSDGAPS